MDIADRRVATLHFTLSDAEGRQITTTQGRRPLTYIHGTGSIARGLENALQGRKVGDRFEVTVAPEEGFGQHYPELVQTIPRAQFNGEQVPAVGGKLVAQTARGPLDVVVTSVDDEAIGVDGNHPLAGKPFKASVEVLDVRLATPEELQFGIV
jgi:FKBP-type peptidyl-prolyl cis-trans isomerase SlyD